MDELLVPRVGVAIIAQNSAGWILLGKRKNAHGEGEWAPPGGHLEFGETLIECAIRELKEETGLTLYWTEQLIFTNDIFTDCNKHYITIFLRGEVRESSEEVQLLEPEKCWGWEWFSWYQLPNPLFLPFASFVKKIHARSTKENREQRFIKTPNFSYCPERQPRFKGGKRTQMSKANILKNAKSHITR